MLVSVIVCTYDTDNCQNLLEAVASLLGQTYPEVEIIIVVDDNETLYREITVTYNTQGNVRVIVSGEGTGVSEARNSGIKAAQGDVVAFLDDDAVADRKWMESMVDIYQKTDAMALAGKILPIWLGKKPDYLPEELYWLVGLTYQGFARGGVAEVRNALGPNMSFRQEVFAKVGLFSVHFGFTRQGIPYRQGEEAEFALRMRGKLGKGVIYNPGLVVYHKVPTAKTRRRVLLKRAFYQGYAKARLKRLGSAPEPLATERVYFKDLLFKYIPDRMKGIFQVSHPVTAIKQLFVLLAAILAVELGFIYGQFQKS